jgi:hypothetical protein
MRKYNQIYNPEKDVSSSDETTDTYYLNVGLKTCIIPLHVAPI